ncbi:tRNA (adenine(22)-N(1))-methyltransferase [Christensenella timonensis]|uniref:tRNA (adenine(22)-N(1))-methyltransferase n=1 Tax=Christensenella timonensis TaxID=1816678 RepID=UPI0008351680|nr:class I SAM-dependent methyltransferase [Christensenella timonensis]
MKEKLSQRMRAIIEMAGKGKTAADIGCDHGMVAQALIREGLADRVIACDISEKSLQKTIDLARQNGWSDQLDARCGDGLSRLTEDEADVIIIAGMGGLLIRQILAQNIRVAQSAKKLVLVPHGSEYELRSFLFGNGFTIVDEDIVREGDHYYQLICAAKGREYCGDELQLMFGRRLLEKNEPLFRQYLKNRDSEFKNIIENARQGKNTEAYRKELSVLRERIREVLICRN